MTTLPRLNSVVFVATLMRAQGWNLVLFGAQSCGACRRLRPTLQHPAVQAVAQVFEVDAHDEPALAAQYGVFHLPALFLLHGADFHAPVEPLLDPAQLAAQLLVLQLQPAQDEP